ncbi:Uncharacterised protein [Mycobacterium tuberculosis]|uniref:Uncharacterized protein n=1 Tax=Mycobacterium tuberculosis TaxID=1773 RepID=A0A655A4Q7_MYCTX|nr:Uncharacterised protein [Mycobacterium tuberculosis]CKS12922.1 Uncharacterised protein [Mycobacterium tuberculosis]CKS60901.1 Uncharacterised protein [Mycobacterium tuberculosis]CNG93840.1 Uncharacterised protein [Mycobacterium tuberculosis]CNV43579.1 Uncharacterised protein [Mycobacterium tuberculosis]
MPVVAEVFGHLLLQGGFEHRLGQRLEQPVRAGQCDPLSACLAYQITHQRPLGTGELTGRNGRLIHVLAGVSRLYHLSSIHALECVWS